jgi:uncharacterized membrane protein
MDPITAAIDKTEELIGHSPHPAVVALPLGAWSFSNVADGLGLLTHDEAYDDAARLSLGFGLIGAVFAAATGLRDYGKIPKDRPSHEVATTHGLGNAVAASLMAGSFIMRTREHAAGRRTSLAARGLSLAGGVLSMYTAWLGGVLVENMGEAVEPVMDQIDDEPHGRERLDPEAPLGKKDEATAS